MYLIGRWLGKLIRKAEQDENKLRGCEVPSPVREGNGDFGTPLNIAVYNAHGGKIVTFRHYDRKVDRSNETTYIVHPDENFEESLGKLIAMEELKRA